MDSGSVTNQILQGFSLLSLYLIVSQAHISFFFRIFRKKIIIVKVSLLSHRMNTWCLGKNIFADHVYSRNPYAAECLNNFTNLGDSNSLIRSQCEAGRAELLSHSREAHCQPFLPSRYMVWIPLYQPKPLKRHLLPKDHNRYGMKVEMQFG